MITPKFSCSQDEGSVTILLYVPSVRASEVEIHVDGTLVTVYINPYFLRLSLPGAVIEDDDSSANYDPSNGYLTVRLTKEVKGDEFKDLDLLAKLLAPTSVVGGDAKDAKLKKRSLIEVLESKDVSEPEMKTEEEHLADGMEKLRLEREIFLEAEKNDWRLPQEVPSTEEPQAFATSLHRPYGFLNSHSGYFKHAGSSENEVNELGGGDAETISDEGRRQRREAHEEEKWDAQYYVADFFEDDGIRELIAWKGPYGEPTGDIQFSEEEKLAMLRLPRKEYLISPGESYSLHLTLLTLLFSYAYDLRTTLHDPTPESAWTICTLTPCISALDTSPTSASSTLSRTFRASYRRALAFPLYRNWALCEKCREDVSDILAGGRRTVLRALLELKTILDKSDVYYLYSKIWVEDYCVWIQSCASDESIASLATQVKTLEMSKDDIGWPLKNLERPTADSDDSDEESSENGFD